MSKAKLVDWEAAVTMHAKATYNAKMAYKRSNAACKVKKSESWSKLHNLEDTVTTHVMASYNCKSESFMQPSVCLFLYRSF